MIPIKSSTKELLHARDTLYMYVHYDLFFTSTVASSVNFVNTIFRLTREKKRESERERDSWNQSKLLFLELFVIPKNEIKVSTS